MFDIKKNDLVIVISGNRYHGKMGRVKHVSKKSEDNVGVEFDEVLPGCHDLNGSLSQNRGYYLSIHDLAVMKPAGQVMKSFYEREAKKR